ncbi:MAG TPA: cyclase family protein [Candidatus Angelobacter sp.]|nr:cyclase family protein [Candidatus Angelobacter sp.]
MNDLLKLLSAAKVYDLAQPYFVGMPHHPAHPPFMFSLTQKHGDFMFPDGASSASDSLALGGHVGTHIDALCHVSCGGKIHGGRETAAIQSYEKGLQQLSVDTVAPIFRRGVLLDIAGSQKTEVLPADFVITPEHLQQAASAEKVEIRAGDVVLLRTGWAKYWEDAAKFIAGVRGPGPKEEGGRWLSSHGIFAAGSDTVAFEFVPSRLPVHVHLLVESGIHIIECLNLEQLAAERIYEFAFAAMPLKVRGGTGSPIRPVALSM